MLIADRIFSIPDPNFFDPGSRIRNTILSIFTQKIVSELSEI
jgi:hypothetical protein